ncbi:hypothetical protein FQZ97_705960 [compost metagenome]
MIDARTGHDAGVDEDDVGHGDEGRQAGQQFGFDAGTVFGQLEETIEQARFDQPLDVSCMLFLFGAFHSGNSSSLLLCTTQSLYCARSTL